MQAAKKVPPVLNRYLACYNKSYMTTNKSIKWEHFFFLQEHLSIWNDFPAIKLIETYHCFDQTAFAMCWQDNYKISTFLANGRQTKIWIPFTGYVFFFFSSTMFILWQIEASIKINLTAIQNPLHSLHVIAYQIWWKEKSKCKLQKHHRALQNM